MRRFAPRRPVKEVRIVAICGNLKNKAYKLHFCGKPVKFNLLLEHDTSSGQGAIQPNTII